MSKSFLILHIRFKVASEFLEKPSYELHDNKKPNESNSEKKKEPLMHLREI
jgi:hypothetical protein